jgi:type IV secretion system protein VirB9
MFIKHYKKLLQNPFSAILLASLLFSLQTSFAQPIPITTDSRIRTLVYNPNEVYELKFYYGYQSFIEFADGEEIEMISVGEAFAWRITPAGKRLFIRPLEISAHTNMTLITNKRTYYFDIRSSEYDGKADEELVYTVRFYYPQIGQVLPIPPQLSIPVPTKPAAKRPSIRSLVPSGITLDSSSKSPDVLALNRNPEGLPINFDYTMAGSAPSITPLRIYDNSKETFMQFSSDNLNVPVISSVDEFGGEQRQGYIIRDGYVVIPLVSRQLTLRSGDSLLCIYNNILLSKP